VIQTGARPAGHSFSVDRTFLRADGFRFVVAREQTLRVKDPWVLPEFRRYADLCDVVQGDPRLPMNTREPVGG
jgi:hypothetical protein